MFKATQNKEAALAFTRFMVSEEAQLAMGKIGQMPVLESLAGNADLPDYYPVVPGAAQDGQGADPGPVMAEDRRDGLERGPQGAAR